MNVLLVLPQALLNSNMDAERIVKFYIEDLLNAKVDGTFFINKKLKFVNVFICGKIVKESIEGDIYNIEVNDGSSTIKCIISKEKINNLKTKYTKNPSVMGASSIRETEQKAYNNTINVFKRFASMVPDFLNVEDVVKIIGELVECKQGRYININQISSVKYKDLSLKQHRQHLKYLYDNHYVSNDDSINI